MHICMYVCMCVTALDHVRQRSIIFGWVRQLDDAVENRRQTANLGGPHIYIYIYIYIYI